MDNKYNNKLNRLTFILQRLSKGLKLSTPNLIEVLQVSKKIIQTDFKEYILNIFDDDTIYYDYSTKTYGANKDFLASSVLSAKELALICILKVKSKDKYSDDNLYKHTEDLFDKYTQLLKTDIYQHSSVEKIDNFDNNITKIKNAISTQHIIKCDYNNKSRKIYPLKILNIEGFWYLINFDTANERFKTYHLNSIKDVAILPKRYSNIDENIVKKFSNSINAYFNTTNQDIVVQLYISNEVKKYFLRKPLNPTQRVLKTYEDGSIDLEIIVSNLMEIIPTIQKYIPFIKVIEPKKLSGIIKQNLQKYIDEV